MAHKWGDRVRESTTTTGTGTIALGGAAAGGYQAFSAVCSNNDTVCYAISDPEGTKWEVGVGTWITGNSITRSAGGVLSGSSGAGSLVSFDAGTKDVMLVLPTAGLLTATTGADVASGAAIVPTGRVFHVTGTTDIESITSTNIQKGTIITMIFDSTANLVHGNNIVLCCGGEHAHYAEADDTLTMIYDGTNWYEVARPMHPFPMGEVNYFNTTGTAITLGGTSDGSTNLAKVAVATALTAGAGDMDNGGANDGRLRYTGVITKHFHSVATVSFSSSANDEFVFSVHKNGSATGVKGIVTGGGSRNSIALHAFVELATNDYIELYVGNMTATRNPTVFSLNLFAMGMDAHA